MKLFICFLLLFSILYCNKIEKNYQININAITEKKYKYWRAFRNGVIYDPSPNNRTIYRFDQDGSFYILDFNFYNFNWELTNDNSEIIYDNIWFLNNDSIQLNFDTYKFEIENINTDSMYIILSKDILVNFTTQKNYYILKPFNTQVEEYFNFEKIKNKKGTIYYYNKKLRNQRIKKLNNN